MAEKQEFYKLINDKTKVPRLTPVPQIDHLNNIKLERDPLKKFRNQAMKFVRPKPPQTKLSDKWRSSVHRISKTFYTEELIKLAKTIPVQGLSPENDKLEVEPSIENIQAECHRIIDNITDIAQDLVPFGEWLKMSEEAKYIKVRLPEWFLNKAHDDLQQVLRDNFKSLSEHYNFVKELIRNHQELNRSICMEFENLESRALTIPDDTKSLFELTDYVSYASKVLVKELEIKIQRSVNMLSSLLQTAVLSNEHMELNKELRLSFTRLFFLSENEIMKLVFEHEETRIENAHYIKKVFPNINNLKTDEEFNILSIIGDGGEEIKLEKIISILPKTNSVTDWLICLNNEIANIIKGRIDDNLRTFDSNEISLKWIANTPSMVILCVQQIIWTSQIHSAFLFNNLESLKICRDRLKGQRENLQRFLKLSLIRKDREIVASLIVLLIHQEDVTNLLIEKKIHEDTDFDWKCQIRYYYQEERVKVIIINTCIKYAYEYHSSSQRIIVNTPLTERCYRNLMEAYYQNYFGAIVGFSSVGKTETMKNLSRTLAVPFFMFSGEDRQDYNSIGKIFKGLVTMEAWVYFKNFRRIKEEILSVIAQYIFRISQSKSMNSNIINIHGTQLSFNPNCYISFSFNPSLPNLSNLPDNLRLHFRTVCLVNPDLEKICQVELFAAGFVDAKNLANSLTEVYSLCNEQMSSDKKYNLKLRNVKAVIRAASKLKLTYPDEDEGALLLRSLLDLNTSQFDGNDIVIFQREAFSGKSTVLNILREALLLLQENDNQDESFSIIHEIISPGALTIDRLYGFVDTSTAKWNDGKTEKDKNTKVHIEIWSQAAAVMATNWIFTGILDSESREKFEAFYISLWDNSDNDYPRPSEMKQFELHLPTEGSIRDNIYIFKGIGNWKYCQLKKNAFAPDVLSSVSSIANAMAELYVDVVENLRPTPLKILYRFSLHDICRIIKGCGLIAKESMETKIAFIRLWVHETLRVLGDRITNDEDNQWLFSKVRETVGSCFKEPFETVFEHLPKYDNNELTKESFRDLAFGNFMDNEKQKRKYEEINSIESLKHKVLQYFREYNEIHERKIDVVITCHAMQHLVRICRILATPGGNLLMISPSGSGRKSLARLAAHIQQQLLFEPITDRRYNNESTWKRDIKSIMIECGRSKKDYTILVSDRQASSEFIQDINNFLSFGEMSELFSDDEQRDIIKLARLDAQEGQRNLELNMSIVLTYFLRECKSRMHFLINISPIGKTLCNYLRKYPKIIDQCSIDWHDWPEAAYEEVATHYLKDSNIQESIRNRVIVANKRIYDSARQLSIQYYERTGNLFYVSHSGFVRALKIYANILAKKQNEIKKTRKRYLTGLDKLNLAAREILRMKSELSKLRPQLEASARQTDITMREIEIENIAIEKAAVLVKRDEETANKKAEFANILKAECESELAVAIPILEDALEALNILKPADITLVKSMKNPPDTVKLVMAAVCVMLNIPSERIVDPVTGKKSTDYWGPSKRLLGDMNFLQSLKDYDKDNISPGIIVTIKKNYMSDKNFVSHIVAKASSAAEGLCKWVRAMISYDTVAKIVAPKKEKLAAAQRECDEIDAFLNAKRKALIDLNAKLSALNDTLEASIAKRLDLEKEIDSCARKLKKAEDLVSGLGTERSRWMDYANKLGKLFDTLAGDVLLSSATITYLSSLDLTNREKHIAEWKDHLKTRDIPFSQEYDFIDFLETEKQTSTWYLSGLPDNKSLIQNAIIMKNSLLWCLFIDPENQANEWIKNMEGVNDLHIVKITDDGFIDKIPLLDTEQVTEPEFNAFVNINENPSTKYDSEIIPNPASSWLADKSWRELLKISSSLSVFQNLANSFSINNTRWRKYCNSLECEDCLMPSPWDNKLTTFQKLMLIRILRPDKIIVKITEFVESVMGQNNGSFVSCNISRPYGESNCLTPIILMLPSYSSPFAIVNKFAKVLGYSAKLHSLSMGPSQGQKAEILIEIARQKGEWVFLHNCHLELPWMMKLEKVFEEFDVSNTSLDFRLWISTYSHKEFPLSILQNSIKVAFDSPCEIKQTLTWAYKSELVKDKEFFEGCPGKDRAFSKLLYGFCLFHAVIRERKHFASQSWNFDYDFDESDLQISIIQLKNWINQYDKVPFKALIYLLGECYYGGKIIDTQDKIYVDNLIVDYCNYKIISDVNYDFDTVDAYRAPKRIEYKEHLKHIRNSIPNHTSPQDFSLDKNADLIRNSNKANDFVNSLSYLNETIVVHDIEIKNNRVKLMVFKILETIPQDFDIKRVQEKYKVSESDLLNCLLIEEIRLYNKFLNVMRDSLLELNKAYNGYLIWTDKMDEISDEIFLDLVPKSWKMHISLCTKKLLSKFITDLLQRIKFMNNWIDNGHPRFYWFGGLMSCKMLLSTIKTMFARDKRVPVDQVTFQFNVLEMKYPSDDICVPENCIYVYGLYLIGAKWNEQSKTLSDSKLKTFYNDMPIVSFELTLKKTMNLTNIYKCPLYVTPNLHNSYCNSENLLDNYILSVNLKSNVNPKIWIKRGTALYCQAE
ncbi:PREDICTED: dynein heavy chain 7, axonemal-like [Ceratosolen solmsi marchali]|uniref:Dynein heavy chain 7, axonemal-like n=1 Tax=Ceratosolen solmsi marchali TaxID=326594 RepID=A0AAJ6YJ14_9HYME|nr:PREDICTED: dynein heavy chain 7, axonemal-like [Ceratosolen solmsi marchali]